MSLNTKKRKQTLDLNRIRNKIQIFLTALCILTIFIIYFGYLNPRFTGFITASKQINYTDSVGITLNESSNYKWFLKKQGSLKSIELSGSLATGTKARISIENNNLTYLIFDSTKKESGIPQITSVVIADTPIELVQNITPTTNKSISANLKYKSGTTYNIDDNGIEKLSGVIDFDVNAGFNWEADYRKLCTRVEIFSVDNATSTVICNGNKQCCSFIGLLPTRVDWNTSIYLTYGLYGATYNNIIRTQVIYFDYNLSIENAFAEITYSDWSKLPAKFYPEFVEFNNICADTCFLSGFNSSSYNLIIEINNGRIFLDKITYIIEVPVSKKPEQVKNFTDTQIKKNTNISIKLDDYFTSPNTERLTYRAYHGKNTVVIIDNNLATIIPNNDIIGASYIYFVANDSEGSAISNIFMINVTVPVQEINIKQGKVVINQPVKWVKNITLAKQATNLQIELPDNAYNISLKKLDEGITLEISEENVKLIVNTTEKSLTEYALLKRIELIDTKLKEEENQTLIAEKEKYQLELEKINHAKESSEGNIFSITGSTILETPTKENQKNETNMTLIVRENVSDVIVEYETPGPRLEEIQLDNTTKRLVVSSDIHYEDILSYYVFEKEVSSSAITLFWIVNNTKIIVNDTEYLDYENNSKINEIQWIIPSLSNQTYEIVISTLNAQIYSTVEGNWTVGVNTSGTDNLVISSSNDTTYSDVITMNKSIRIDTMLVGDYTYENKTGSLVGKLLAERKLRWFFNRNYFDISLKYFFILILIISLNWVGYLYYKKRDEKKRVYHEISEQSQLDRAEYPKKLKTEVEYIESLREYVKKCLNTGYTKEQITETLLLAKWPSEKIKMVFKELESEYTTSQRKK